MLRFNYKEKKSFFNLKMNLGPDDWQVSKMFELSINLVLLLL